jgi:hypothetical protein
MLVRFLGCISSGYVIFLNFEPDCINSLPHTRNFISPSGGHYYLCGDASMGNVVTAASIYSEQILNKCVFLHTIIDLIFLLS